MYQAMEQFQPIGGGQWPRGLFAVAQAQAKACANGSAGIALCTRQMHAIRAALAPPR